MLVERRSGRQAMIAMPPRLRRLFGLQWPDSAAGFFGHTRAAPLSRR